MNRRRLMESSVDYSQMYLTFEAIESGTFSATGETQYSLDDGATWVNLSANSNSPTISGGSKIMFKAYRSPSNSSDYIIFTGTAKHNVMGNPYSVIYGDDFKGVTSLSSTSYSLYRLFEGNNNLVNAKNLSLPATTLANACYSGMFQGCTNLTTAPELPATTLANNCYSSMFYGCTSLTTAPELPATTLATSCYYSMFYNCTSLTTAPELPATTLATSCYQYMFRNCTSLNYIKAMFTTTPGTSYTANWVDYVASSGTFVKNVAATWNITGVHGVPNGWTIMYE